MSRAPVPESAVFEVARALEQRGAAYAFMGGIAVNTWAIPRATFDLDVLVESPSGDTTQFLRTFSGTDIEVDEPFLKGYLDRFSGMEKATLRLLLAGVWFTVDMFFVNSPFLRSAMERRLTIDLGADSIQVITAADLLLLKLLAGRRKDQLDIENLVALQGLTEADYLRQWADRLGIRDRLDRLLE